MKRRWLNLLCFLPLGCGDADDVAIQSGMDAAYRDNKAGFDSAATPRRADGPGGYLDQDEQHRRNLDQTGVHDKSVPLPMRQERARELGYPEPKE